MNRVELPNNFGVDLLRFGSENLGRIFSFLSDSLVASFSVPSRLMLRAMVDVNPVVEVVHTSQVRSFHGVVANAVIGRDSMIRLFRESGQDVLEFGSTVTCFHFIAVANPSAMLAVGLLGGFVEVWKLTEEMKCVFRFDLGKSNMFPLLISADDTSELVHVVPNRGKVMLAFDAVAMLSGNSGISPVLVDLIQPNPLQSSASFRSIIATSNSTSIVLSDAQTHHSQSLPFEGCSRTFWTKETGHLIIVRSDGTLFDASWANGLVGVATIPTADSLVKGSHSLENLGIAVNSNIVDCNHGILATVKEDVLEVYMLRHSSNRIPVSQPVSKFEFIKEEQLHTRADEDVVSVTVVSRSRCAIVLQSEAGQLRVDYIHIDTST